MGKSPTAEKIWTAEQAWAEFSVIGRSAYLNNEDDIATFVEAMGDFREKY